MAQKTSRRRLIRGLASLLVAQAALPIGRSRALLFPAGNSGNQPGQYGIFNVKAYGALGNGVMLTGVSMSSSSSPTHLICASTTGVIAGNPICVQGAGASGKPLVTTVASITNGTTLVLGASADTTVANSIAHTGTDDTSAIQSAITACYNAGAGTVFFPAGIYYCGGALQSSATYNAQLVIPTNAPANATVSIALVGVSEPSDNINCCGLLASTNYVPASNGSILFTPLNGSGSAPSFVASNNLGSIATFSNVALTVANLTLRSTYRAATPLTMIHAQFVAFTQFYSLDFDVDATDVQQGTTAPTSGGMGFSMPDYNNGANQVARDIHVTGYDIGFGWGEHGAVDNINVQLCNTGALVRTAYHELYGGSILLARCKYGISAGSGGPGKVPLYIAAFRTEHDTANVYNTPDWYATTDDVLDASNVIYGKMASYDVIITNTGFDNAAFTKSGGSNFTCTALF